MDENQIDFYSNVIMSKMMALKILDSEEFCRGKGATFKGAIYYVTITTVISSRVKMYIVLTKCEVKMAGYWSSSLFAFLWTESELAWSIKDLLYGIKSAEKNDLRTCLFSSTEKEPS